MRDALHPWLSLANLVRKIHPSGFIGPALLPEPREEFRNLVPRAIEQFPVPLRERLTYLLENDPLSPALVYPEAFNSFAVLSRISQWKPGFGDMPIASIPLWPERLAVAVVARRVRFHGGLFNDHLLRLLEGIDARRIRPCPICGELFYAFRVGVKEKTSSKACSERCNDRLRTRNWRKRQWEYEYNRKLKSGGLKGGRKKER